MVHLDTIYGNCVPLLSLFLNRYCKSMKHSYYIPNNLRAARKAVGLRQIDVAEKLGIKITDRISHWEKGQGFPHLVNLFKLAAIYGKLPHELYAEYFEAVSLAQCSHSLYSLDTLAQESLQDI